MPLPGSDKYRVVPIPKPLTWEQKLIERANKEIRIEDVLSKYYNIHVPYDAVSWKVRCPYAYEHEDGGLDKQFRIYSDSNNGYCFAMHGRIDNIRLYREIIHAKVVDVAKALLDEFDIDYRKVSYKERFEELRNAKGVYASHEQDVIEAMKIYLNTIPGYEDSQYDDAVLTLFQEFLDQVHDFCLQASSFEEVQQWFQEQKKSIHKSLLSLTTF